ncbi:MAG: ABC transporter ATP-binding protein [Erysipelotrichaceae bacterium]|nr:ABC transporter ATP-binding protein [Erysipelotrichaceae bacterium]
MNHVMISVKDLSKRYGNVSVLSNVSFQIQEGEIFAILGSNGAGKTTLLECIEGLRDYSSGSIQCNSTLGIQLQNSTLPPDITPYEALTLYATWNHTKVDHAHVKTLGITPFLYTSYHKLSTGQQRRLHLALALLTNSDILILDEPTAALDIEGRYTIHQEILRLKKAGKTIILATHDMNEVEQLCDRLLVLKKGKIAFQGTLHQFTKSTEREFNILVTLSAPLANAQLKSISKFAHEYKITTTNVEETLGMLSSICIKHQVHIMDIHVEAFTAESQFMELVKEEMA